MWMAREPWLLLRCLLTRRPCITRIRTRGRASRNGQGKSIAGHRRFAPAVVPAFWVQPLQPTVGAVGFKHSTIAAIVFIVFTFSTGGTRGRAAEAVREV